ncbi:hypothetical protein HZS_7194, partial [Henneguya salminicola]
MRMLDFGMNFQALVVLGTRSLIIQKSTFDQKQQDDVKLDSSDDIKFFKISPDSKYLMWSRSLTIELMLLHDISVRISFPAERVQLAGFSPRSTFLWVWCSPSSFQTNNVTENFKIYRLEIKDGKIDLILIHSSLINNYNHRFSIYMKISQLYWLPDESYCLQWGLNKIKIFNAGSFEKQIDILGLVKFSMASTIAAESSQPFRNKKDFTFYWNNKGNIVIITCLDITESRSVSYYGKDHVYFLGHKGEAFQIEFGMFILLQYLGNEEVWAKIQKKGRHTHALSYLQFKLTPTVSLYAIRRAVTTIKLAPQFN